MGWAEWQNRRKEQQHQRQQQRQAEKGGKQEKGKHEGWKGRLRLEGGSRLGGGLASDRDGKGWEAAFAHVRLREGSRRSAPAREERLRVRFPVKLGMAGGGADFSSLVLRIVRVEGGVGDPPGLECGVGDRDRGPEQQQQQQLERRVGTAGGVMNAAAILVLGQACYGPAATVAAMVLAGAGFTRLAMSVFCRLVWREAEAGWPARLQEFAGASLVLSLGVPVLRWRCPGAHRTLRSLGAAVPVALGYARTEAQVREVAAGAGDGGAWAAERLWRQRHRWAARRLCGLLTDFQNPPTVGWLVEIWESTTVALIPSVVSGRVWVVGSTRLPLRLESRNRAIARKAGDEFSSHALAKRASNSAPGIVYDGRDRRLPEEDGDGRFEEGWDGEGTTRVGLELGTLRRLWERSQLALRACYLFLIFGPLLVWGPLLYVASTLLRDSWAERLRRAIWWILRFCLEKGGAAFIKWGQWSATREDLFPEDLCRCLGRLHDQSPEHSFAQTRKAVLRSLGRPIEELFEDFPRRPCASGSIAQVYQARLRDRREGMPEDVAVKVRHPSVALRIYQDFQIMSALAAWAEELPALRWLKLRESVDQFSHTLTAQADLRTEADNLVRFRRNFETPGKGGDETAVVIPQLIPDLVSEAVIVESFERGHALHRYLHGAAPAALNTQIAAVGVDTYLKMLLTDNFVHTDLHPGNILARVGNAEGSARATVQLVLLDFGLAQELSPSVRYHFLSFILMIGAGDGERAAHHLLRFSEPQEQMCPRPRALAADMRALFTRECDLARRTIDLNLVLVRVLQLCRKHEVTIDSGYASLVVAVCVLVGFARSLDPELSIMDAAVPCLFLYNLTGQIMGRIYG